MKPSIIPSLLFLASNPPANTSPVKSASTTVIWLCFVEIDVKGIHQHESFQGSREDYFSLLQKPQDNQNSVDSVLNSQRIIKRHKCAFPKNVTCSSKTPKRNICFLYFAFSMLCVSVCAHACKHTGMFSVLFFNTEERQISFGS